MATSDIQAMQDGTPGTLGERVAALEARGEYLATKEDIAELKTEIVGIKVLSAERGSGRQRHPVRLAGALLQAMKDEGVEMAGLAERRADPAQPSPPVRAVQAAPSAGNGGPGGPGKTAALSERERITALETAWQYLATKEDLAQTEASLRVDLANTEGRLLAAMAEDKAELKKDIADVRAEIAGLKLWMLGAVFGGNATLLGLAALLYRLFVA